MLKLREDNAVLWLFLAAVTIILTGIGFRDAWPPDEPRFVLVAKEMVQTGQWLIPMRGGEIYPDKPPVFMWAIALVYLITGNMKIAMLLPNAIASIVTLVLTYRLSRSLSDEKTALLSVFVLLLCPQFLIQAKFAQIDAMVACFIWIGVYGFVRHFFIQHNWRWYFTAWAFMGLGIITKGVGFLPILLLIPIAYFSWRRQLLKGSWKKRAAFGPLVMLLVIFTWLGPLLYQGFIQNAPDIQKYLSNILFKQTAQRYANAWHHIEPWYYYLLEVIPAFWLSAVLVVAFNAKRLKDVLTERPPYMALFIWVVLVATFFSISSGKRGVYVLPALPAISMVAGLLLARFGVPKILAITARLFTFSLSLIISVAGVVLIFNESLANKLITRYHSDAETLTQLAVILVILGILGLATHIIYVVNKPQNKAHPTVPTQSMAVKASPLGMQLVLWIMVMSIIPSTLLSQQLNSFRTPTQLLDKTASAISQTYPLLDFSNIEIGIVDFKEQYLLYAPFGITHFGYHTAKATENGTAWAWLTAARTGAASTMRFILAPKDYEFQCADLSKTASMGVAHRDEWLLIPETAAFSTCELSSTGPIYPPALTPSHSEHIKNTLNSV